eukprot:COSAG02_NODE_3312_length_6955_cov_2.028151_7_plen_71_part_00
MTEARAVMKGTTHEMTQGIRPYALCHAKIESGMIHPLIVQSIRDSSFDTEFQYTIQSELQLSVRRFRAIF